MLASAPERNRLGDYLSPLPFPRFCPPKKVAEKDSDSEDSEDFHNSEEAVMLAQRSSQGDHADNPERLIVHPPVSD